MSDDTSNKNLNFYPKKYDEVYKWLVGLRNEAEAEEDTYFAEALDALIETYEVYADEGVALNKGHSPTIPKLVPRVDKDEMGRIRLEPTVDTLLPGTNVVVQSWGSDPVVLAYGLKERADVKSEVASSLKAELEKITNSPETKSELRSLNGE